MAVSLINMLPVLLALSGSIASVAATGTAEKSPALAPGYGELKFKAPVPGSYSLPVLGPAGDGQVLDSEGSKIALHEVMSDAENPQRVYLLSFIYSTCSDVNGCPLATAVLHKLGNKLAKESEIANQVRLITISFNPSYDTPARMKAFGAGLQSQGLDWRFLTTRSELDLQPILEAYRLTAEKVYDSQGKFTNTYNHPLRVFLIDGQRQIRNIYNTELLHPDTLFSDIRTLLQAKATSSEVSTVVPSKTNRFVAGDNKTAYETADYRTDSVALKLRQGRPADLLKTILQPPLGLPPVPIPHNNPPTREKIDLGRKLFYDRRLSINNTFSCAMCHVPEQGFTSNEMATAVGVEGRAVRRNTPTLYNVAYMQMLFHDGRESSLEQQVWGPFLAHNEMANPSIGYVIDKIKQNKDYEGLFEQAFGEAPDMRNVGMAIASYERTLNSANSPFDRWSFRKDRQAISDQAKQGFKLFTGKAGCSECHRVDRKDALFMDNRLHNTGIGYASAMSKPSKANRRVQLAPGVFAEIANEVIDSVSQAKPNDMGRYEVTQRPEDRWSYKTPTLRNIALTAPYMHDGSLPTLEDVIEFYNRGGIENENLDPHLKPLKLSKAEVIVLVAFLKTLTGENVQELVSDAFAAPVGDSQ